ncbi:hypothetical protein HP439_09425 [Sphingobacterium shayense]|uniref:hypothetical protein n=1 Tax=Sphingobacterium shayense TaxID=626343 RepID=UPI00155184A5|nr:hypothetical protein [Sphingobacterium shayense]NQD70936.1 hypothetical protein [Sphingobacterium shayense]
MLIADDGINRSVKSNLNLFLKEEGFRAIKNFLKKLSSSLKRKWVDEGGNIDEFKPIPEKGIESADFILKVINHVDHVPAKIKEAFDKLIALD